MTTQNLDRKVVIFNTLISIVKFEEIDSIEKILQREV